MTHKLKQDDPDIACAKTILDKGWRQGAIYNQRAFKTTGKNQRKLHIEMISSFELRWLFVVDCVKIA